MGAGPHGVRLTADKAHDLCRAYGLVSHRLAWRSPALTCQRNTVLSAARPAPDVPPHGSAYPYRICGVSPRSYSITSSARASSVAGTSRPSALAVLRLTTSSYLVGPCTGRSDHT